MINHLLRGVFSLFFWGLANGALILHWAGLRSHDSPLGRPTEPWFSSGQAYGAMILPWAGLRSPDFPLSGPTEPWFFPERAYRALILPWAGLRSPDSAPPHPPTVYPPISPDPSSRLLADVNINFGPEQGEQENTGNFLATKIKLL